ncbi:MAG: acetyl-CoA carboxylase carboxyltransferase component, partial [Acidimicrobiales bacterium]
MSIGVPDPSVDSPRQVELRAGIRGSVRAGVRSINGQQVVSFTVVGDLRSMSQADGMTIGAACELARAKGHPVVGFVQSTGADVREGITAAHGWGSAARAMIKCSGIVPTVLVVTGPVVSGPALMLGIADVVIMVQDAYAFVSGPAMVEQFTGLPVDHDDLGGPSIHATKSGVVTAVV